MEISHIREMNHHIRVGKHLDTGHPLHIDSAESGLKCRCICYECGQTLIAAKGQVMTWHFRHQAHTLNCGGGESRIHLLAKHIIATSIRFRVSPHEVWQNYDAREEAYVLGRKIDIALSHPVKGELLVEVKNTHVVDVKKKNLLCSNGYRIVEVDVSGIQADIAEEQLRIILLEDYSLKVELKPEPFYDLSKNLTSIWQSLASLVKNHPVETTIVVSSLGFWAYNRVTRNNRDSIY